MRYLLLTGLASLALSVGGCSSDTPTDNPTTDAGALNDGAPRGDSAPNPGDGGRDADGGGPSDFASFVLDLVENHTADNTPPAAYPDESKYPDTTDPNAFKRLFP